jgi:hypothetical protein
MSRSAADSENASSPDEREYEGVYVAHWEVARFVVLGRRVLGFLWRRVHKWQPLFPREFRLPDLTEGVRPGRGAPRYYRMRVRGTVGPRGHFGHLGLCEGQLTISAVLSFERTDTPGRTW